MSLVDGDAMVAHGGSHFVDDGSPLEQKKLITGRALKCLKA